MDLIPGSTFHDRFDFDILRFFAVRWLLRHRRLLELTLSLRQLCRRNINICFYETGAIQELPIYRGLSCEVVVFVAPESRLRDGASHALVKPGFWLGLLEITPGPGSRSSAKSL